VGAPYFDTIFVPLMVPVVFIMGVGPMARWRDAEVPDLARRLRWAGVGAVLAALLTSWLAGRVSLPATLGFLMTFWIVGSILTDLWERARPAGQGMAAGLRRLRLLPRAMVGMLVAHLGVAAFAFGVSMVKTYAQEGDVRMQAGDTTQLAGYVFTFRGTKDVQGPNYDGIRGEMEVRHGGGNPVVMQPEKRIYRVQKNPMTEAAIDPGMTRDLYVALGEQNDDGSWVVHVYVKPFVDWIWGGCLLMAIGGALALSDRRYRVAQRDVPSTVAVGAAA